MGKVKCPRFGCHGVGIPVDTKKKFSFGKALIGNTVGGILAGPGGALVGTATGIKGKNGKTTFVCSQCGKTFEKKL
jgi:hypothetical protein